MAGLDETDRKLIALLQHDDRMSLGELGAEIGAAPSTINDRIKRLVRRGIVSGFHARLDPEAIRLDLLAFVFVGWSDPATEAPFLARIAASPAALECHHVTGAWNYLLKVRVKNMRALEEFLSGTVKALGGVQRTESIMVLSTTKETWTLEPA